MKKWLDDLYAIILKHGFNTLNDVLKNDNEYKESKINDNVITLNSNEAFTFNLHTLNYNIYDRLMIFNRGHNANYSIVCYLYKYDNNNFTQINVFNNVASKIGTQVVNDNFVIRNLSSNETLTLDLYVKKIC